MKQIHTYACTLHTQKARDASFKLNSKLTSDWTKTIRYVEYRRDAILKVAANIFRLNVGNAFTFHCDRQPIKRLVSKHFTRPGFECYETRASEKKENFKHWINFAFYYVKIIRVLSALNKRVCNVHKRWMCT